MSDVTTTFIPSTALPLARRVLEERAPEASVALDTTSAVERIAAACQQARQRKSYSDGSGNPRGRDRVHREIAESPCVDELAGALTQFFLGRYEGREPRLANVKPRVASLTNGLGCFSTW